MNRAPGSSPAPAKPARVGLEVLLTVALAVLAGVGWLAFRDMTAALAADRWETHTYQVIHELGELLSSLKDAETGQRGFIITGAPQYLEPYRASLAKIQTHLTAWRRLTADDPRQPPRLAAIAPMVAAKLAELKETIALRDTQGFAAASAAVMTHAGKSLMDQLRAAVGQAERAAAQRLRERTAAKEETTRRTIQAVALGGALGAALLVLLFVALKLELARRRRAEAELRQHRDQLQELVDARTAVLREANAALGRQQQWLRVTLSSIGDAVLATDTAGHITFLNPVAERLTGWSEAQALGQPVQSVFRIINEQTRAPGEDIVARVLRERQTVALANHTALVTRDGREAPIEDSAAPITEGGGENLVGAVLVFHDVTEKRRAQEALHASEARLQFALETTHTGAWELNLRNHSAHRSLEHDRIFGYAESLPAWTYEMFLEHVLPEDRARVDGAFRSAMETQSDWSFECRIRRADGPVRWIWAAGRHRLAAAGGPDRMAGTVQDITARKEAQVELERLNAELERRVTERTAALQETTDQLNAFVYTLAHDLRAPLRAQVGFATILLEDHGPALGETGRNYARRIADAAERQGNLLTDLLKHISLSREDLPMEPVDLPRALGLACADLVADIQRKQARVSLGPLEPRVLANAASLHLILTNLVANAIKFVAPGVTPAVRIQTERRAERVRLWVEDNGLGIAPEHRSKLFGIFQRLQAGPEYPGTGIGLAIVKKAAERMGGQVGVESEAGQGSRFWVELGRP